jgi:hypothetical protein
MSRIQPHILLIFTYLFTLNTLFGQVGQGCYEDLLPRKNEKGQFGYSNLYGQWKVEPVFSEVKPFSGDKAIVKKGKKVGVVNCDGYLVLSCEYDEVAPFSFGRFWAKKNGKWSLFEPNGKVLKENAFNEIKEVSLNANATWVKQGDFFGLYSKKDNKFIADPQFSLFQIMSDSATLAKKDKLFGVVSNISGEFLVEPSFEKVKKQTNKLIAFKEFGKWGLMTLGGRVIKTAQYDSVDRLHATLLLVKNEGKYGVLDMSSKPVLPIEYESIGQFSDGLVPISKDGKFGYFTILQTIAIAPQYDSAFSFKNGAAIVVKNGKYGLIDNKNKSILPLEYNRIVRDLKQPYIVVFKNSKQQLYDLKSGWVNGEFDRIYYSDSANLIRVIDKGKEGFFNMNAKNFAISPDFDSVGAFYGGFSIGKKGNQYGAIDTKGNSIVPFEYQGVQYEIVGINLKFKVLKNGVYGILDKTGKVVIPAEYQLLLQSDLSTYKAKKDGKYGLLKSIGQPITGFDYELITNKLENSTIPEWPAIVRKKGKYGLLANSGIEIVEPIYSNIAYQEEGIYAVQKGKKIGLVDSRGNLVSEPQFESVGICLESQLAFQLKGKWGVLSINGQILVQPEYDQYLQLLDASRKLVKGGKEFLLLKGGKLK